MPSDVVSQISLAVSDREFWGSFVDAATIVVIIGAALESIAEIPMATKLFRLDEPKRKSFESLGFWVLMIGLCGEFAFGIPVANDTATIETKLGARINAAAGVAQTAKGNANTALSDAQQAQRDLAALSDREGRMRDAISADEARLQPRLLTEKQRSAMRTLRGKVKTVAYMASPDTEPAMFGAQIAQALYEAGIEVIPVGAPDGTRWVGIQICFPDKKNPKQMLIWKALSSAFAPVGQCEPPNVALGLPPDVPLIVVGERPAFFPNGQPKSLHFRAFPGFADKAP